MQHAYARVTLTGAVLVGWVTLAVALVVIGGLNLLASTPGRGGASAGAGLGADWVVGPLGAVGGVRGPTPPAPALPAPALPAPVLPARAGSTPSPAAADRGGAATPSLPSGTLDVGARRATSRGGGQVILVARDAHLAVLLGGDAAAAASGPARPPAPTVSAPPGLPVAVPPLPPGAAPSPQRPPAQGRPAPEQPPPASQPGAGEPPAQATGPSGVSPRPFPPPTGDPLAAPAPLVAPPVVTEPPVSSAQSAQSATSAGTGGPAATAGSAATPEPSASSDSSAVAESQLAPPTAIPPPTAQEQTGGDFPCQTGDQSDPGQSPSSGEGAAPDHEGGTSGRP